MIKAPFNIIKFADKFNKIANNNKKILLDIKKDNGLSKEYINVIFEENPNNDKKLYTEYDEETENINTNNVSAVIIALFIPNENKIRNLNN